MSTALLALYFILPIVGVIVALCLYIRVEDRLDRDERGRSSYLVRR